MTNAPTAITTERDFPADRALLKGVRKFIAEQVGGLAAADDAVLAGSELAANAIEHGSRSGASITVTVTVVDGMIRVDVTDGSPVAAPRIAAAYDDESERGRGLLLVEAIASRWGCNFRPGSKTTWCEFQPPN